MAIRGRPHGASWPRNRPAERAGLAGQDQERGLEGVLGVVLVTEDRRQTPSTIGPCRSTRAVNAAWSAPSCAVMNRWTSCPSDRSPTTPNLKSGIESIVGTDAGRLVHHRSGLLVNGPPIVPDGPSRIPTFWEIFRSPPELSIFERTRSFWEAERRARVRRRCSRSLRVRSDIGWIRGPTFGTCSSCSLRAKRTWMRGKRLTGR